MQPKEKRTLRIFLQPRQGPSDALSGRPVHQTQIAVFKLLRSEGVIIKIEAPRQTPTAVEHERAHHRALTISMIFEGLSDRSELSVKRRPTEIQHSFLKVIHSSHDHRM